MANTIKLKRGTSTPTTSNIVDGEVAIDKTAKKLYLNDGGTIKEIGGGGGGGVISDSDFNTVGGTNAGDSITNGTNNTFFGYNAGTATTAQNRSTAFGSEALAAATTNSGDNSAFGHEAGKTISSGTGNTCIGRRAGQSITNETGNVVAGFMADTEGDYNIILGQQAGQNSTGSNSVVIGTFAGEDFTGASNHFIGYECAKDATSSTENVCIGRGSARDLSSGSKNVIIGQDAADTGTNNLTTGDNNIIIGHDAAASSATVDNEITLGDTAITKFRVPALNFVVKSSTATEGHVLTVDASGEAGFAAASGGGGSLTLISSTTFTSAVSAVTFTSISGYTQYKIIFNMQTSGAGTLEMRVGIDGTYDTGNNYIGPATDSSILILGGFSATSKQGEINIFDLNQAESTLLYALGVGFSNDETSANHQSSGGAHSTAAAQNCIQLFGSSGNISSGTVSLYGIATS